MALNTTNFPPDLIITNLRGGNALNSRFTTRLTGNASSEVLTSSSTAGATAADSNSPAFINNVAYEQNTGSSTTGNFIGYAFRRATGFFDVVCYNGSGVSTPTTVTHNLGVAPEMIIMFGRTYTASGSVQGQVWTKDLTGNKTLYIFNSGGLPSWGNQSPTNVTATTFVSGNFSSPESTSNTFVAYLFASLPGISKVGSYTGNGSSQTINCGFADGARFVLIKRTDSTGDWYVWDTARGIIAGNDPHLSLNTNAAEVTTDDSVDPQSSGFIVNQVTATNINVSAASYIYLAIA